METIDTWCTDKMICPFCGCVVDSTDYGGDDVSGECDTCGREFDLKIEYTPTYTTSCSK